MSGLANPESDTGLVSGGLSTMLSPFWAVLVVSKPTTGQSEVSKPRLTHVYCVAVMLAQWKLIYEISLTVFENYNTTQKNTYGLLQ